MARKVTKKPPLRVGFQDDGALRRGDYHGLDEGQRMGAKSVRVIIPAADIRKAPGQYDFSTYDQIVDHARARGVQPQLVLDTARGFTHGADAGEFARFSSAAAKHFKGRVSRYSLMNEPDMRMSPQQYRQLYQRGRRAVKRADAGAHILFGEFSPRDPVGYAKRVIGKGGIRAEGFAWHPYQRTSDPLTGKGAEFKGSIGNLGKLSKQIAGLHLRTGKGHTPGLFLTEFGYRTRPGAPDQYGVAGQATDDSQAVGWWPRAIRKAQGNANVRQLIAYHMSAAAPDAPWDTSLLDAQGNPRLSYRAIQAANRRR